MGRHYGVFIGAQLGGLWWLILETEIDQSSTSIDSQRSQWPVESEALAARESSVPRDSILMEFLLTVYDLNHIKFTGRSKTFNTLRQVRSKQVGLL